MHDNRNSFFSGDAPDLSYHRENRNLSLLEGKTFSDTPALATQQSGFGFGQNYSFAEPTFGSWDATPTSVAHHTMSPELQNHSSMGVMTGTAKAILKDPNIPISIPSPLEAVMPTLGYIGVAYSAYKTAVKIDDAIFENLENGQSRLEAQSCGFVKVLTHDVAGGVLKKAVVGGVPMYLVAAVESPIIAATLPVILPLIPSAYSGAELIAEKLSLAADEYCHSQFQMK